MNTQKLNILLVDNNQTNVALFKQTLTLLNLNCELFLIFDNVALNNFINSNDTMPNYIFLDVNLPNVNILNCLRDIKTKHPSNTFYIIMMTNNHCQDTLNTCYRYGASCMIDTNIDEEYFINILDYCFTKMHKNVFEKEFIINNIVKKSVTVDMI